MVARLFPPLLSFGIHSDKQCDCDNHVTVIDCTGTAARSNSTVVVTGGRISTVGPSEIVTIPAGARVVDANGKFMIPGLWDMHGHLTDATEDASLC